MSDKRENFIRLANKRVNNAIKTIRLIGNLSNKASYNYSAGDIDKVFSTLNKELKACKYRFENSGESTEGEFSLK